MELHLFPNAIDEAPRASRRSLPGPQAAVIAVLRSALELRHLIAIATIVLLIAVVGASPQL